MQPKIQAMALHGVTVECRESTENSSTPYYYLGNHSNELERHRRSGGLPLNRQRYPGQFEMICYQVPYNSSFLDSEGKFIWDDIHEENTVYSSGLYGWENLEKHKFDKDFMTMETSFNLTKFELWIMSDRCNPNNHCGRMDEYWLNGLTSSPNIL